LDSEEEVEEEEVEERLLIILPEERKTVNISPSSSGSTHPASSMTDLGRTTDKQKRRM
jgi:hypothetical protein